MSDVTGPARGRRRKLLPIIRRFIPWFGIVAMLASLLTGHLRYEATMQKLNEIIELHRPI